MAKKINVAELLNGCPKGMELDCTILDNNATMYLKEVLTNDFAYPIVVTVKHNNLEYTKALTKHGSFNDLPYCNCVIFPKGKTTWEGFVPPCKFKTGDVLYIDCADKESDGDVYKYIFILKEIDSLGNYFSYCHLSIDGFFTNSHYLADNRYTPRFATEEEKQKLFDTIKTNGYYWNSETKTLETLIEPKFKVGDKISNGRVHSKICSIDANSYQLENDDIVFFKEQNNFELVPNKFDITTLKPFDKVLVRRNVYGKWEIDFFGYYDKECYHTTGSCIYEQCIPYEGNEHLLNTTDDCDEFYKTWK